MTNPTFKARRQLLIDDRVQWPILQRTAFYTTACAVYFMVVLFYVESNRIGHESFSRTFFACLDVIACWAPGLMLLVPIISYDILLFTNRFAGPMFRLRREMQRLIDGESDQPIAIRSDDHWPEMADLFNQIQAELIELRKLVPKKPKSLFSVWKKDLADPPEFEAKDLPCQQLSRPRRCSRKPNWWPLPSSNRCPLPDR